MDWLTLLLILGIVGLIIVALLGGKIKIGKGGLELDTAGLIENLRKAEEARGWVPSKDRSNIEQKLKAVRQGSSQRLPTGRVLWVDDHPINNYWERLALADIGVMVDTYTVNSEAVLAFSRNGYDLVISDIGRDGKAETGFDLLRELRERDESIPFFFYTAKVEDDDRAHAKQAGATDSFDLPEPLLSAVLENLRLSARR